MAVTTRPPPGAGVMDLLHDLHGAGTTVLIITHNLEITAALPRQVRMHDGRIAADSGARPVRHAGAAR